MAPGMGAMPRLIAPFSKAHGSISIKGLAVGRRSRVERALQVCVILKTSLIRATF